MSVRSTSARAARQALTEAAAFYRRPGARRLLVLSAVLLFYVGSIPVYYIHAVVREEAGPRIGHVDHWALDSTLVFLGLTPALAVVLPLAFGLLRRLGAARPGPFALLGAAMVTAVTAPGPFLHKLVAGRDTVLADAAEVVFGREDAVGGREQDLLSEALVQVVIGAPTYTLLFALAVALAGRRVLTDREPHAVGMIPTQRAGGTRQRVPLAR